MRIETQSLKIAIVHDWLVTHRGGERVLDAILEIYPSADVFTLFCDPKSLRGLVRQRAVRQSWLSRLPGIHRHYRKLLPLMPLAVESLDLSGYDLVISTSHCVAKGVIAPPGATHICYCFSPARYAWDQCREYLGNGIVCALTAPYLHYFRLWDFVSAQRVDHFATSSAWVASRIEKFYRRPARIISPFADLEVFSPGLGDRSDYYLVVSALVPYKRIELAIAACRNLKRRLIIVGRGPEEQNLRRLSDSSVVFETNAGDARLNELYGGARALLFPGVEDFGIVPLEAMACGTPVIALGRGGALETVIHEKTGLHFSEASAEGLAGEILRFERDFRRFDPMDCRTQALRFSRKSFQTGFRNFVEEKLGSGMALSSELHDENPLQ